MNKLTALLLGLTLILCGCTAPRESWQRFSQVYYDAFDTVIVLTVYAESEADFRAAASDFEAELRAWTRFLTLTSRTRAFPGCGR